MNVTGTVVTTKVLKLNSTDILSVLEKNGWRPEGWKFFSVKVGTNAEGDELTLTLQRTEKLEP